MRIIVALDDADKYIFFALEFYKLIDSLLRSARTRLLV